MKITMRSVVYLASFYSCAISALNNFQVVESFTPPSPVTFFNSIESNLAFKTKVKRAFVDGSRITDSSGLTGRKASNSPSVEVEQELAPIPEEWRGEVLKALSNVIDPDLNRDIVTLGFIKELALDSSSRTVSFSVELTTPACPIKELFQSQCEELVLGLPWTKNARVTMTAPEPSSGATGVPYGLSGVSSIIAVSSCKGGVGKSTTAVNLAYALQSLGASVGIFDADVYGPSLPTMITPDDDNVQFIGRQISPLQRNGVKLMSFGYVNEGAAIMRGPMITQLLDQFISLTYWGQLDYLILDMPPGTGDIQLTLSQRLNITAAVIVTTPTELSFVDVERGIEMFDSVNVPSIAVVENMAYIDMEKQKDSSKSNLDTNILKESFTDKIKSSSPTLDEDSVKKLTEDLIALVQQQQESSAQKQKEADDNSQLRIFGPGHRERLSKQWGIEHTFTVPLVQDIAQTGDSGTPFILQNPDSPQAETYYDLASSVVMEVSKINFSNSNKPPFFSFDAERHMIEVREPDSDHADDVFPADLRRECKCAECVEELTGRQLLQPQDVSDSIKPINIAPCGNYALSVDWSDGHRSLYPYKQIRSMIQAKKESSPETVLV